MAKITNLRSVFGFKASVATKKEHNKIEQIKLERNDNLKEEQTIKITFKCETGKDPIIIESSVENTRQLYARLGHILNPPDWEME